jgi:hypothetical protein
MRSAPHPEHNALFDFVLFCLKLWTFQRFVARYTSRWRCAAELRIRNRTHFVILFCDNRKSLDALISFEGFTDLLPATLAVWEALETFDPLFLRPLSVINFIFSVTEACERKSCYRGRCEWESWRNRYFRVAAGGDVTRKRRQSPVCWGAE